MPNFMLYHVIPETDVRESDNTDRLTQEKCNSSVLAMELYLFCIK